MSEPADGSWAPIYTPVDLGLFLRDLRTQRGLTQAQLADELGVTRQYVVELEGGKPNLYSDRLFQTLRLLGGHLRAHGPSSEPERQTRPTRGVAVRHTHR